MVLATQGRWMALPLFRGITTVWPADQGTPDRRKTFAMRSMSTTTFRPLAIRDLPVPLQLALWCLAVLFAFAASANAQNVTVLNTPTTTKLWAGTQDWSVFGLSSVTSPGSGVILEGTAISVFTGKPVRHMWYGDSSNVCAASILRWMIRPFPALPVSASTTTLSVPASVSFKPVALCLCSLPMTLPRIRCMQRISLAPRTALSACTICLQVIADKDQWIPFTLNL
jgi:hypothetical protein